MKKIETILMIGIVLMSAFALVMPVTAQDTVVSIEDVSLGLGESKTVPIMIEDVTGVVGTMVNISYNSSVVHITGVANSDFCPGGSGGTLQSVKNNTVGFTRIIAQNYTTAGLTGDVKLAEVTLEAKGDAGDWSYLNITIDELYQFGEVHIDATPDNGTFTITGEVAPTIVSYTISNTVITPPQTTDIDVEFSETVDYIIAIEKDAATIYDWTGTAEDPNAKEWDGTYEVNDTVVPDGDYTVNVTGTSTTTGLSVVDTTKVITVTSEPYYGVELTVDEPAKTIVQGGTATYTLTVKNTGNVKDTIDLTKEGIGTLSKTTVDDLAAGESENVTLEVSNTTVGDHETTVNATSQGDASKTDSVTVTTTVEEERYGVELTVDDDEKTVYTSKTATYTLTVKNTGNVADTINLTQVGIGTLSKTSLEDLGAGATKSVSLSVSSGSTGTYETTVTATSQTNTSKFDSKTVTTTVKRRTTGGGRGGITDSDGDGYSDIQEEYILKTDLNDPCDPDSECAACLALKTAATPTAAPTAAPTAEPTAVPTAAPTAEPTAEPTATPEPPGFEAVFAIAGLLAVAYLVLRRKSK